VDPKERLRLVDDLNVARRDLTATVEKLLLITDRIVDAILQLIKAER